MKKLSRMYSTSAYFASLSRLMVWSAAERDTFGSTDGSRRRLSGFMVRRGIEFLNHNYSRLTKSTLQSKLPKSLHDVPTETRACFF